MRTFFYPQMFNALNANVLGGVVHVFETRIY